MNDGFVNSRLPVPNLHIKFVMSQDTPFPVYHPVEFSSWGFLNFIIFRDSWTGLYYCSYLELNVYFLTMYLLSGIDKKHHVYTIFRIQVQACVGVFWPVARFNLFCTAVYIYVFWIIFFIPFVLNRKNNRRTSYLLL